MTGELSSSHRADFGSIIGRTSGASVLVLRALRSFRPSDPLKSVFVVLALLCLAGMSMAQAAPSGTPAPQAAAQSPAPAADTAKPDVVPPDPSSGDIPTAAQVKAEGERDGAQTAEPAPGAAASAPAAKPPAGTATTASTTSPPAPGAKPDPNLPPKYNVALIGQRNVGGGLDFYSLEREMALGRQLSQEVESSARLVTDPVINEYINRIGQNLVRNSDARVPFTIKVLDTEEVNAFALPGGFFYVNSGLILAADNEAELAGVMAHEIAHVAARHATKNMTRAQIWNMASVPLIFIGGPVAYAISEVAGLAVPLGFLKFSRDAQREADLLGLEYDYATGYDPEAFVEFFEKLNVEKKKPNLVAKAFATHPMNVERIEAAQEEIRKYLPDRPEYIVDTSEFEAVKARLASLENGRHIGTGKQDPSRPVLLKRTSGSAPDSGSGDSTQQADSNAPDRPTLKRNPSSGSGDSTQGSAGSQGSTDDRPTLKRDPSSGSGDSTQGSAGSQDSTDDGTPTLKRSPSSTPDFAKDGVLLSAQELKP